MHFFEVCDFIFQVVGIKAEICYRRKIVQINNAPYRYLRRYGTTNRNVSEYRDMIIFVASSSREKNKQTFFFTGSFTHADKHIHMEEEKKKNTAALPPVNKHGSGDVSLFVAVFRFLTCYTRGH